jgi:hypothetical protein
VLIVLKSGSLKLLEPSGPVQACNGIAAPFHIFMLVSDHVKKIKYSKTDQLFGVS